MGKFKKSIRIKLKREDAEEIHKFIGPGYIKGTDGRGMNPNVYLLMEDSLLHIHKQTAKYRYQELVAMTLTPTKAYVFFDILKAMPTRLYQIEMIKKLDQFINTYTDSMRSK